MRIQQSMAGSLPSNTLLLNPPAYLSDFFNTRDITPTYHGPRGQQPAELDFIIAAPLAK